MILVIVFPNYFENDRQIFNFDFPKLPIKLTFVPEKILKFKIKFLLFQKAVTGTKKNTKI